MSLETSSFFESPVKDASELPSAPALDASNFFGDPVEPALKFRDNQDALTDATSPNTTAATPAPSDGWIVEDTDEPEDYVAPDGNMPEEDAINEPTEEPIYQPPVMARNFDGKLVVIRKKRKSTRTSVSISEPKDAISKLVTVRTHKIMEQLAKETAQRLDLESEPTTSTSKIKSLEVEETLWTDKYRPRHFTDLLGDERVHRDTMLWVKEWDACVFPEKMVGRRKKQAKEGEETNIIDLEKKLILLLSGPPGLGKTTLAHVVARQAGYAVMEINASDARSGATIDERIRPVLEAGTKVGGSKPVLVVIDEIDGATGGGDNTIGFVQRLLSMTIDKPKKTRSRNQKDTRRPLLRPIICICNDLYAASLAKLRPVSRIVRFQPPAPVHLVKRLKEICEMEDLRADSRSLTALVGASQGDMRGCLNTLQLLKAKHSEITEPIVRRATMGMKESEGSFMDVLTDIFTPLSRSRVKDMGLTSEEEQKYVHRLNRSIESTGAVDKVALACFEHYLNYRIHDADFKAYEKALRWLATYDHFTSGMWQDREYSITPYIGYSLIAFHPTFATKGGPKLERPKADWEAYQRQKTYEEVYRTLQRNVLGEPGIGGASKAAARYRHLVANGTLQLEFAPLLNRIISPPLKPVNKQVIKPEERLLMSRVVEIMVTLDLHFIQEKQEDGTLVYRLDPPIDAFVTYDEKRAADIAVSRYATRHLIAAEIDAQVIERQAEALEETSKSKASHFFGKSATVVTDDTGSSPVKGSHEQEASSPLVASRKRKREEQEMDIADKSPVDFFGRLIAPTQIQADGSQGLVPTRPFKVTYKYTEGMSAAVRKPVKMISLLD
ncbi:Chromosome transmission fidelity protein 18 [Serendipita indica DSM 11827]|nr:Chromosome transmission fidelity protein 18 [Serendipita indica DSM 11827]